MNQQQVYAELRDAARTAYPELSEAQAVTRFVETPAGAQAYREYQAAPPADEAPPARLPDVRRACERRILEHIDAAAAGLQRGAPHLTHAQAVSQAVEADPQLYADYQDAQRMDTRLASLPPPPVRVARAQTTTRRAGGTACVCQGGRCTCRKVATATPAAFQRAYRRVLREHPDLRGPALLRAAERLAAEA